MPRDVFTIRREISKAVAEGDETTLRLAKELLRGRPSKDQRKAAARVADKIAELPERERAAAFGELETKIGEMSKGSTTPATPPTAGSDQPE